MGSDLSGEVDLRRENALLKAQIDDERRRFEEIRHRVKNELQLFTALFAAQRARCGHPEDCTLCVSRVAAVSAMHQTLDAGGQEKCRLGAFISRLARMLSATFGGEFESVVTINGEVEIDSTRAKCIGLVLAEATMNALKHGFAGIRSGRIETRLYCSDSEVVLIVENNGKPFSPAEASQSLDEASAQGLGLIQEMAAQLGGRVEISGAVDGTSLRLAFPVSRFAHDASDGSSAVRLNELAQAI